MTAKPISKEKKTFLPTSSTSVTEFIGVEVGTILPPSTESAGVEVGTVLVTLHIVT